jgi:hypothetical protein
VTVFYQPSHAAHPAGRPADVRASGNGALEAADILSPGPGAIAEGIEQIERIVMRWVQAAK